MEDGPAGLLGGPLDALDQRILGALLEKQTTVPTSYPLTLNALRIACNQTSSRDPLTSYDDRELELRARDLKHRDLIKIVVADRGQRTLKYHQRLDERLGLDVEERALLTVLLLRGAQAAGELKTRTERLHPFAGRGEVEALLARMAERGLARELPRRVGQHDARWVHTLGPTTGEPAVVPTVPAVDRERVLTDGPVARDERVRAAYDAVAAARLNAEQTEPVPAAARPQPGAPPGQVDESQAAHPLGATLDGGGDRMPERAFDAWLLRRIAARAGDGPIADVGCGAGWAAGQLAAAGARTIGYDVAPRMVDLARLEHPGVAFEVGDLRRLLRPPAAPGWAAITAWYAFGHLAPSELPAAVAALARVLLPGGELTVAAHAGADIGPDPELFGLPDDPELVMHDRAEVIAAVEAAGLTVRECFLRAPEARESPTERLYVRACAPR